jgi:hypothetical protein
MQKKSKMTNNILAYWGRLDMETVLSTLADMCTALDTRLLTARCVAEIAPDTSLDPSEVFVIRIRDTRIIGIHMSIGRKL